MSDVQSCIVTSRRGPRDEKFAKGVGTRGAESFVGAGAYLDGDVGYAGFDGVACAVLVDVVVDYAGEGDAEWWWIFFLFVVLEFSETFCCCCWVIVVV